MGEHGGGGVVARAKVQTVKVKSLSLLFSYVDVVFIPDTTCGEGVKFFSMHYRTVMWQTFEVFCSVSQSIGNWVLGSVMYPQDI